MLILSETNGSASIASFATLISAPIGITCARISFIFPFSSSVTKKVKAMRKN